MVWSSNFEFESKPNSSSIKNSFYQNRILLFTQFKHFWLYQIQNSQAFTKCLQPVYSNCIVSQKFSQLRLLYFSNSIGTPHRRSTQKDCIHQGHSRTHRRAFHRNKYLSGTNVERPTPSSSHNHTNAFDAVFLSTHETPKLSVDSIPHALHLIRIPQLKRQPKAQLLGQFWPFLDVFKFVVYSRCFDFCIQATRLSLTDWMTTQKAILFRFIYEMIFTANTNITLISFEAFICCLCRQKITLTLIQTINTHSYPHS